MRKMPEAKLPLPRFKNESEAAEYFGTHSVADIWDKLPPGRPVKLSRKLSKAVRERHARGKTAISIRLEPEQIIRAKRIAQRKSVGYQTQLRLWIAEGIQREQKRRAAS